MRVARCLVIPIIAVLCLVMISPACSITVAVYGQSTTNWDLAVKFQSLGYTTLRWDATGLVSHANLSTVDVLFVNNGYSDDLIAQEDTIADFVFGGGGLIVEQPNIEGSVAIMPPGLDVYVWDHSYDSSRSMTITPIGVTHPITAGLTSSDISRNADKVRIGDISTSYQILAVQTSNPNLVGIAAGSYGSGRVVFETGSNAPISYWPGSDRYLTQLVNWTANVPEPSSLLGLALGFVGLAKLWRRR